MKRKARPPKERARLFLLHEGICHFCLGKIDGVKERWELSHIIEWELTHDDSDGNCAPAHYKCHRNYTYKEGNPMVAKTLEKERKNMGIRNPSKWPTGRGSKFKKTFSGQVIRRDCN